MSENKKVIHVKDLVIKAENVRIEPERHRDPFFRGREREVEAEEVEEVKAEDDHEKHENEESDDRPNRPPFSWI
ncbi:MULTISPECIES: hypothetical protein [Gracilibacillus]|uniref:hypothetical protein n=1 Tax=Gracilibacillus TaxID=74385 RepID=UPI000826BF4F|nr:MULTISPECIES: hypothetical protein [Gracilibacillus]